MLVHVSLSAQPVNEGDHPPADTAGSTFLPNERVFFITAVLLLAHRRNVESGLTNKNTVWPTRLCTSGDHFVCFHPGHFWLVLLMQISHRLEFTWFGI